MRVAPIIELTAEERTTLTKYSRGRNTPAKLVLRAKVVLRAAEGLQNKQIAVELGTDPQLVGRWRTRFANGRLRAIEQDAPRSGRKPTEKLVKLILEATTQEKPAGATHWSVRTLAQHLGISSSAVHRVWRQHNLQPHRTQTFKVSNDPKFEEKLHDVVGLYLAPPEHAIVLSVDE